MSHKSKISSLECPPSKIESDQTVQGYASVIGRPIIRDIELFYKLEKKLGAGAFGAVFLGTSLQHNYKAALKIVHKSNLNLKQRQSLKEEMNILSELGHHKNIVNLYECLETVSDIIFCMEVCEGGELFDAIVNSPHYKFDSEHDAAHVMHDAFKAIAYCHQHNIVHRDLKPENLLLDRKQNASNSHEFPSIKIIDFGLSKHYDKSKRMTEHVGTIYYMAPEVLDNNPYEGGSSDIWSLGVILYILLSGKPPFNAPKDDDIRRKILSKEKHAFPTEDFGHASKEVKDLINRCLEYNPKQRITAKEALLHPWIVSHSFGLVSSNTTNFMATFPKELRDGLKTFHGSNSFIKTVKLQIASLLHSDQIKKLHNLFNEMDLNHTGTISCNEIKLLLQKFFNDEHQNNYSDKTTSTSKLALDILSNIDIDHDGEVSYLEFIAGFMSKKQWQQKEMLHKVFDMFDLQKTNKLTRSDLLAILNGGHKNKSEANTTLVNEMMNMFDLDHDGGLSRDEFEKLMYSEGYL